MGFGEMRLIAANTAGASAAVPASTKTTPSSPICTPMFPPAPAITKKEGRTSRISRLFDEAVAACVDAALRGLRLTPCLRENAAQTATTAATRTRRHQSGNMVVIIRRTVTRRLTHNLNDQQEQAQSEVLTVCHSVQDRMVFRARPGHARSLLLTSTTSTSVCIISRRGSRRHSRTSFACRNSRLSSEHFQQAPFVT